jgi:hypothetical protein
VTFLIGIYCGQESPTDFRSSSQCRQYLPRVRTLVFYPLRAQHTKPTLHNRSNKSIDRWQRGSYSDVRSGQIGDSLNCADSASNIRHIRERPTIGLRKKLSKRIKSDGRPPVTGRAIEWTPRRVRRPPTAISQRKYRRRHCHRWEIIKFEVPTFCGPPNAGFGSALNGTL